MKKIISLVLVFCLCFSLCACKRKNEELSVATPSDIGVKNPLATLTDALSSATASEEKCKHEYTAATCTKAKVCKLCDETSGEPLGHKWQKATCKTFKTCSVCKAIDGKDYGDHSYKNGYCTVCDKKDPDFGSLTSHNWQLLKASRLITISFSSGAYSEAVVKEVSKMTDDEQSEIFSYDGASDNIIEIGGKQWYGMDGRGVYISYKEEKGTVTIAVSDPDYPEESGKTIVLKRVSSTTLRVTKCTLKSSYWKIRKGDVLTAVIEKK